MKRTNKIPRVLKINQIKGLKISVVFNTGESRWIDFEKLLPAIGVMDESSPAFILYQPAKFKKVTLDNHTLSWKNTGQMISSKDGQKKKAAFEIGADVLYDISEPDTTHQKLFIGDLIQKERLKAGMTQEVLARKSGTTPNYISRIENNRSGIELNTLQKIVEIGLGKELKLSIQ